VSTVVIYEVVSSSKFNIYLCPMHGGCIVYLLLSRIIATLNARSSAEGALRVSIFTLKSRVSSKILCLGSYFRSQHIIQELN